MSHFDFLEGQWEKDKELASPIYATSIGLLIHGIENLDITGGEIVKHQDEVIEEQDESDDPGQKDKIFGKLINKIYEGTKDFFEAKEDIEF